MEKEILTHRNDPRQLEKLYRSDRTTFKRVFSNLYPQLKGTILADFWKERLYYENEEIFWGTRKEIILVLVASFVAGLFAKIPQFTGLDPEFFYPRNIGFLIFPFLIVYFAWKHQSPVKNLVMVLIGLLASVIYINILPGGNDSDTLLLSCIHLPLLLWAGLGFIFTGNEPGNNQKRMEFLRYNGDLVVMTTIILIAGGLMTAITLGLFELIDLRIEDLYFEYVGIWGLAAAPIVGTFLVRTNPGLVNKVSPVVARVFTPLLLVMLIIYLSAVIITGKDPYNDREFLLIFNVLLIGVMAIILFSIAETSGNSGSKFGALALLGLSIVTIIVNGIALSAIGFRIAEWGITPNRLAVLGGNILILINLVIVAFRQFEALKNSRRMKNVEYSITSFLPIYIMWASIVSFVFPVLFGFE